MNWKTKAKIQRTFALLPDSLSYALYSQVQWFFGNAKGIMNPLSTLTAGVETLKRISAAGYPIAGKTFFELGTGWSPMVPLAYWLAGAEKTITVDLNRYLKKYLLKGNLDYIHENKAQIAALFGPLLNKERFETLLNTYKSLICSKLCGGGVNKVLALCHIDYRAPCDAAKIKLPDKSIDYYTSFHVFEHIPPEVLVNILAQGSRILKDGGLFVHCIDYRDHFAFDDKTISKVNFLQYSDKEWSKYMSRYSYVNRLRHDDFLELLAEAENEVLSVEPVEDEQAQHIRDIIETWHATSLLDVRFQQKKKEILAITSAWIVTRKI